MALQWKWSEKVGTVTWHDIHDHEVVWTSNLYVGNAWLIEIWESDTQYHLTGFWADKAHFNNCMKDSIYADEERIYTFYFEKLDKLPKDLIKSLIKSVDSWKNLSIVYCHEPKKEEVEYND